MEQLLKPILQWNHHKTLLQRQKIHLQLLKLPQPSSTSTSSKQPHATPNFDNMDIKAIKEFMSARGVQVSNYRKPQLIELAKAIASMDLPIDPHFENCSIDECLIRRLTLPAGLKIPDPF